jgi:hypothetical protein
MEASVSRSYVEIFAFLNDLLDFRTREEVKGGHGKGLLRGRRTCVVWIYLTNSGSDSVTDKSVAEASDYIINIGFALIIR